MIATLIETEREPETNWDDILAAAPRLNPTLPAPPEITMPHAATISTDEKLSLVIMCGYALAVMFGAALFINGGVIPGLTMTSMTVVDGEVYSNHAAFGVGIAASMYLISGIYNSYGMYIAPHYVLLSPQQVHVYGGVGDRVEDVWGTSVWVTVASYAARSCMALMSTVEQYYPPGGLYGTGGIYR